MSGKLRYALVGCGGCGCGKHLESYRKHAGRVDIVALCDILPEKIERARRRFNLDVPGYTDYRAMLRKERLDLISVATPNAFHAPVAVAALRAGVHVHSEKPLSTSAAGAQKMVDAKNASGKKLMVGLNNRYTELSLFLKQYIADGRLGKIYTARCGWRRRRGIPGKGGWFTTRALSGGGPLIDLGVHFFDLTLFFMGFPAPTSVLAATYDPFITRTDLVTAMPEGTDNAGVKGGICDVEDLATGFVRFENGATVSFEFSWASNIERDTTYFELLGTRGGIKFEDGIVQLYSEFEGRTLTAVPAVKNTSAWGENETAHFLDCILHNKPVMSPPEEAVRMMQIIDAAYKSAASGKPVSIR